jgi:hypothetical protein
MMNSKGSGKKWLWPKWGTTEVFSWSKSGKPRQTSFRINCVLAKIRT